MSLPELIPESEVAAHFGCHKLTLREYMKKHGIRFVKAGRERKLDPVEVAKLKEALTCSSSENAETSGTSPAVFAEDKYAEALARLTKTPPKPSASSGKPRRSNVASLEIERQRRSQRQP